MNLARLLGFALRRAVELEADDPTLIDDLLALRDERTAPDAAKRQRGALMQHAYDYRAHCGRVFALLEPAQRDPHARAELDALHDEERRYLDELGPVLADTVAMVALRDAMVQTGTCPLCAVGITPHRGWPA